MPLAARVLDVTAPGGQILGPGSTNVMIGGKPAALMNDQHLCSIPANAPHPQSSIFPKGSTKVRINGKFALRAFDQCICEACVVAGFPTVNIG